MEMLQLSDLIHLEILAQKYSRKIAVQAVLRLATPEMLNIASKDLVYVEKARQEFRAVVAQQKKAFLQHMHSDSKCLQEELEDELKSAQQNSCISMTSNSKSR